MTIPIVEVKIPNGWLKLRSNERTIPGDLWLNTSNFTWTPAEYFGSSVHPTIIRKTK